MHSCDFDIYDMISRNANLYPDRDAILYGDQRISFKEYKELCDRCSVNLKNQGVDTGDRIAILSNNNNDFLILCGAAAKIGAIVVPINYRLNETEIEYILNDSNPKCIFISKEYKEIANKASMMMVSAPKKYVFQADEKGGDIISFRELLSDKKMIPSAAAKFPSGNSAYIMIYTAAVGGKPKGCLLSQTNILAVSIQMAHMFKLTDNDCHIGTLPLFHIGGFSMTLAVMHQGGKNLVIERFDPVLVLNLTNNENGTFFGTFPPMLSSILDAQDKLSIDTPSLRGVGGMDSGETIQRFLNKNKQAIFYSLYGQTEAMPISGCDIMEKPGSVGRPAIMTRVAIYNDLDQEVNNGEQGEICVRSQSVFLGYWNLKEDTEYTFRNDWHHTGDLGRIDKDGFLWYMGRKPEKELIKPGGENVYPVEVEKTIVSHGSIEEVCVIGVPDPEWGEAIKAVCVRKKGSDVGEAELIEFVASKIARYKKPKYVIFVENLPKRENGEINRVEVKNIYSIQK